MLRSFFEVASHPGSLVAALATVLFVPAGAAAAVGDDWGITRRADDEPLLRQRLAALHRRPFGDEQMRALRRTLGATRLLTRLEARVRHAPNDPAWTIVYARALLASRRPDEAATALGTVAGAAGRYEPRFSLLRAKALEAAGHPEEALSILEAAGGQWPDEALLIARRDLARRAGRLTVAVEAARRLAERAPGVERYRQLADLATRARDPTTARAAFERAWNLARGRRRAEVAMAWARAELALGAPQAAADLAERAAEDAPRPQREEALRLLVSARRAEGRLDRAAAWLEARAGASPKDPAVHHVLGLVRLEQGGDARPPLRRAHALAPRDRRILDDYVTALLEAGDLDGARAVAVSVRPRGPEEAEIVLRVADRLLSAGRREDALAIVDRLVARRARDRATLAAVVDFWNVHAEESRALTVARAWAKARPRDVRALVALGEQLHALGHRDEALAVWSRLPAVARPSHAGRARLAELLADHGHLYRAVAELRTAIEKAPDNPAYHRTMAVLRERSGQDAAALAHWKLVLDLARGPDAPTLRREARTRIVDLLFTGRLRDRSRRLQIEIHHLSRLLDAEDPRDEALRAGRLLAEIHARAGHHDEAVAIRRRLLALSPGDPQAIDDLARALRRAGRIEEAARVLARRPARSDAELADREGELALLAAAAGHPDEAIERALRAATAGHRARPLLDLGARLEEAGDLDGAARAYAALARTGLEPARARLAAGRLDLLRGRGLRARATLLQVLEASGDPSAALAAGRLLHDAGLVPAGALLARLEAASGAAAPGHFDAFVLQLAARMAPESLREVARTPTHRAFLDATLRRAVRGRSAADRILAARVAETLGRTALAGDILQAAMTLEAPASAPAVTRHRLRAARFVLLRAAASLGGPEHLAQIAQRTVPGRAQDRALASAAAWALALAAGEAGPRALLEAARAGVRAPQVAPGCVAVLRLAERGPVLGARPLVEAGARREGLGTDGPITRRVCPLALAASAGADRRFHEALLLPDEPRAVRAAYALGIAAEPTDEALAPLVRRVLGPAGAARDAAAGALRRLLSNGPRRVLPPPPFATPYAAAARVAGSAVTPRRDGTPFGYERRLLDRWLEIVARGPEPGPLPSEAIARLAPLLRRAVADIERSGTPAERAALAASLVRRGGRPVAVRLAGLATEPVPLDGLD